MTLRPGLRRVLAPNPSALTFRGTNSYLLGDRALAVIDPGPDDPAHLAALLAAIGAAEVSHIIVTHSHLDHSPLARALSRRTGAPVLAFGDALAGRSAIMSQLAATGVVGGGEGIDAAFVPDRCLRDAETITGDGWSLGVVHTPGHLGNHICLRWGDALFSGDHIMGWATSVVSPPDGDLTDFMASCRRLQRMRVGVSYPGHGDPVPDTRARLDWLIGHRQQREAQIVTALRQTPDTVEGLTRRIYTDVSPTLWPVAARNVLAHLVDLAGQNKVTAQPALALDAQFALVPK
jgi:glyoxylase-like metal-dependent hydrolase (beta-lactamase superfamily II)